MNVLGISITRAEGPASKVLPVLLLTATGVVAATGTAFAVWSTTGAGTGTAKASSFTAPGVAVSTATPATALYPGGTSDLLVMATNSNPFAVTVTLAQDLTAKVTSDKAGCNETVNGASTVTGVTLTSGTITIPANTTTAVARSLTNAVAMSSGSSTNCIGATFTIPLTTSSSS